MAAINDRLKEPSTHAGIAAAIVALAPVVGPIFGAGPEVTPVANSIAGVFAALAVFLRERASK